MANNDHHRVTAEERELFDALLDELIETLPGWVHDKLEEIPLVVEDYPSDAILDEMGIEDPGDLCGLHSGIPLTERSVEHSGVVGAGFGTGFRVAALRQPGPKRLPCATRLDTVGRSTRS